MKTNISNEVMDNVIKMLPKLNGASNLRNIEIVLNEVIPMVKEAQRLAFVKMIESKKQIEYPVEGLSTNKPDDNFNLEANKYIRMTNRIYDGLLREIKGEEK